MSESVILRHPSAQTVLGLLPGEKDVRGMFE